MLFFMKFSFYGASYEGSNVVRRYFTVHVRVDLNCYSAGLRCTEVQHTLVVDLVHVHYVYIIPKSTTLYSCTFVLS